jgi:DNA-binding NtrC family response regulator
MKLRILHLEDDANDAELVSYALKEADPEFTVTVAANREQFRAAMAAGDFDVILSDNKVPGFSGADALQMTRDARSAAPFIFVCGSGSLREAEMRAEALQAGAADWVSKSGLKELAGVILRAVRQWRGGRGQDTNTC